MTTHDKKGDSVSVEKQSNGEDNVLQSTEGTDDQVKVAQEVQEGREIVVINEEKEDGEWSTPTKVGRSSQTPTKALEYGQVSILSSSRFAVLSDSLDEGDEPIEKDNKEKGEEVVVEDGEKTGEDGMLEKEALELKDHVEEGLIDSSENKPIEGGSKEVTKKKNEFPVRPSLPRNSKDNHKVVSATSQKAKEIPPSALNPRTTRRNN